MHNMSVSPTPSSCDGNNKRMEWHEQLLEGIQEQNLKKVKELFSKVSEGVHDAVNSPIRIKSMSFKSDNRNCKEQYGSKCFKFTLPIVLAAMHLDGKMVQYLYSMGADVFAIEPKGNSIIHALVWVAAFRPQKERRLCKIYRQLVKMVDKKRDLLYHEDDNGLRPIELAAKLGAFLILREIMETEGVYKSILHKSHIARRVRYDLTEYQCSDPGNRRHFSPLFFLRRTLESDVEKEGIKDLFEHPPIKKWINTNVCVFKIFSIMYFISMLLVISGIVLMDEFGHSPTCTAQMNNTQRTLQVPSELKWSIFYLGIFTDGVLTTGLFICILRGLWRMYKKPPEGFRKYNYRPDLMNRGRKLLVDERIFIGFLISKTILLLIYGIITLTVDNWTQGNFGYAMLICRCMIQFQLLWNMLFYVQLSRSIGYIVAGIFDCSYTSIGFLAIFSLFYAALSEALRSVSNYYCLDNIGYAGESLYSTFLLTLNMLNPRDLFPVGQTPLILIYIHVVIVALLGILLLNYLIALLSDVVGRVERNKNIILAVADLNVSFSLFIAYDGIHDLLPKFLQSKQENFYIECDEYTV